MNSIINKLLIPIQFDDQHLTIVKQAAEIAKKHNADLYLLNVQNPSITNYFHQAISYKKKNSIYSITENKVNLMQTWKRWIEKEYQIKVHAFVDWGNWKKLVIAKAKTINASLIVLPKIEQKKWYSFFNLSNNNYIIEKSPCQVISFISDTDTIVNWKNIVIPITNFIPELRIKTIIDIVKSYDIKLHLIAFSSNTIVSHKSNFYYLTETLKILKASGNIQVECKCLTPKQSLQTAVLKYAKEVNADAIITNKKPSVSELEDSFNSVQSIFNVKNNHAELQNLIPA